MNIMTVYNDELANWHEKGNGLCLLTITASSQNLSWQNFKLLISFKSIYKVRAFLKETRSKNITKFSKFLF